MKHDPSCLLQCICPLWLPQCQQFLDVSCFRPGPAGPTGGRGVSSAPRGGPSMTRGGTMRGAGRGPAPDLGGGGGGGVRGGRQQSMRQGGYDDVGYSRVSSSPCFRHSVFCRMFFHVSLPLVYCVIHTCTELRVTLHCFHLCTSVHICLH